MDIFDYKSIRFRLPVVLLIQIVFAVVQRTDFPWFTCAKGRIWSSYVQTLGAYGLGFRFHIHSQPQAPKDLKASPQREAENPETETETGLVEDGPTSESEGPSVDPLPLMPGRLRPLPQTDQPPEPAEMELPPPIPMDAPPPPTAPAPLESQVKPSRHTRRPLPGLMEDETLQETSEEVQCMVQMLFC